MITLITLRSEVMKSNIFIFTLYKQACSGEKMCFE